MLSRDFTAKIMVFKYYGEYVQLINVNRKIKNYSTCTDKIGTKQIILTFRQIGIILNKIDIIVWRIMYNAKNV